jgi:hypothetical protein
VFDEQSDEIDLPARARFLEEMLEMRFYGRFRNTQLAGDLHPLEAVRNETRDFLFASRQLKGPVAASERYVTASISLAQNIHRVG